MSELDRRPRNSFGWLKYASSWWVVTFLMAREVLWTCSDDSCLCPQIDEPLLWRDTIVPTSHSSSPSLLLDHLCSWPFSSLDLTMIHGALAKGSHQAELRLTAPVIRSRRYRRRPHSPTRYAPNTTEACQHWLNDGRYSWDHRIPARSKRRLREWAWHEKGKNERGLMTQRCRSDQSI